MLAPVLLARQPKQIERTIKFCRGLPNPIERSRLERRNNTVGLQNRRGESHFDQILIIARELLKSSSIIRPSRRRLKTAERCACSRDLVQIGDRIVR
jgi:hypothetical protein